MIRVPVGLFAAAFAASVAFAAPRPNIVYFYVDDMGWGAIGPNGQDARRAAGLASVKTPNIDSLADAGINFQRAYGCTVCSPARSSLMTGYHQGHTWADRNDTDNAKKAMRADDVTIGDALKAAGYVNGYWGKWGFGGSQDNNNPVILNIQTLPQEHGFDDVLAELHHVRAHTFFQPTLWSYLPGDADLSQITNSVSSYTNYTDYPEQPAYQNDASYPATAYCDDYYAFRALDFVRAQAQQYNVDGTPFFACFSPQIPHSPYGDIASLPEWDSYYDSDTNFPSLTSEAKRWAAMVTRIDAHFGNVLDALEDPNGDGNTNDSVAASTLVIFQSDNGGANNNGRTELGANGNLRSYKGSIWEGGIRIPMVMRWPAMIHSNSVVQAGSNSQKVIDTTDMLPTFCELAGVEIPLGVDGVSLAHHLMGETNGRSRDFVIHEAQPDRSIVRGDMKLVDDNGTVKLYDLGTDPSESTNIASTSAALVTELSALLYGERVAEGQWFANTYHDWTGADGAAASDAANWSDYIYSNSVNSTVYDTDSGAPQVSWVAKMRNSGVSSNLAVADTSLDFLALEISGASSNAMQMLSVSNCTVTGRNEVRVKPFGHVQLDHGTLTSLRWVDLQTNATIEGSGTIDATLYHAGRLSVTESTPVVVPGGTNDLLTNGGFESGTGNPFNATDEWFNSGPDQTANARNTTNPHGDSYRGIVGNGSKGLISPTVDTGHTIQSSDTFTLSFHHAGAGSWDLGDDTITATLYYNDGSEQAIGSITVTPTQNFADGYDATTQVFNATVPSAGHSLSLRIESTTAGSNGEFAAIDDVELTVSSDGASVQPGRREYVIKGDYRAESTAELHVVLAGAATQAVDYAHVVIDGDATLAGSLEVTVDGGFAPAPGNSFEIMTASSVTGAFANAGNEVAGSDGTVFSINYSSNAVTLVVDAEPTLRETNAIPSDALISLEDDNPSTGQSTVANNNTKGQCFVLSEDSELTGFVFQIQTVRTYGEITLSLYAADGSGLPTGDALHSDSAALPGSLTEGDYVEFLFSTPVEVTAGAYVIALSTTNADFVVELHDASGYAAGTLVKEQGSGWQTNTGVDFVFGVLGTATPTPRPDPSSGPNVIHILVDDWGWTDSSVSNMCDGNVSDLYDTPNVQRLSDQGVSFTWAYANPNCAPTRAALMTGQYACRSGNGVYNVDKLNRGSGTTYLTAANQSDDFINGDEDTITLAEAMVNSGYVTAHIGKYHVGSGNAANATHPLNQGIDHNYGGNQYGAPGSYFALSTTPRKFHDDRVGPALDPFAADYTGEYVTNNLLPYANGNDPTTLIGTKKHLTDATADAFVHFMNEHHAGSMSNYPVYVQYHFYSAHSPLQGRPDLVTKYTTKKAATSPTHDLKVHYAALVENMDHSVGRVMDYLNDPNGDGNTNDSIAANSLILFTGDNGGDSRSGFTSNYPLRKGKGTFFEGGLRVPLVAWMPGTVPAGKVTDSMVHAVDFYPTILDFASGVYPDATNHPIDGVSFHAHVINPEGVPRNRGPIFYHFPGYLDERATASSTIIKDVAGKRYKYIYAYDPYYENTDQFDQYQLYNLTDDLSESVNLMDYIDIENAGDAEDPSDSAEYWNYLLYKGVADNLASNLNTWLVGAAKGATWQPIHATYKQNFADISPVIDDPDVGTLTTPAPGAAADVDPPTNFTFSIAEPALTGGSQFEFTFDSHSNFTYQIQMAQSLKSNVWSDHGSPIAASSNRTTAVIDLGAESKGYYRIVLTQ